MTLDEAIKRCEEVIKGNENLIDIYRMNECYDSVDMCENCNKEHRQLAEWLKELRRYKELDNKAEGEDKE